MPANDNWASQVLVALTKLANSPSNTWNQASTYAGLPDPSTCAGSTWLVLQGSGIWPLNNPAGWYCSDGDEWQYLGAYNPVVTGGNVVVTNFPAFQPVTIATLPAISGTVGVNNFPATQAVSGPLTDAQLRATPLEVAGDLSLSGSVDVGNFPAVQPVSGTLAVSNFPVSQAVTGTFWQATQPISGSVSVSNFPATQPVSGTFFQATQPVSGTFWQATQPISGTVSVGNFPVTQPVSGTFWQATQPISGAVSVSNFPASQAVTGTFWQATQPISGAVSVSNFPATQPVSGTFWQATQPVSGTVAVSSLPAIPAGTNNIGDVDVLTLPALPAGTNNIGDVDVLTLPALPAGTNNIGDVDVLTMPGVSLGNTTGKTNVLKTGTLVTTATTADQVVLTYTVTAGKTFYLQYFTFIGRLTVIAAGASILGATSLETPSGTKAYTMTWTNPTISLVAPNTVSFCEPIPIAAGTVIRVVCTPAAVTSMTWIANFGGYEK